VQIISLKINETYRFSIIFRLRRLYSICSVKKRSWGFFGGSIDTIYTLFMNFLQGSVLG
jgi:hypothetical protein